jgi:CRP-like cAMP-binding protein
LRNQLLAALPGDERAHVRTLLEPVFIEARETLYLPTQPVDQVYFPETVVVSLVTTLQNGSTVEIGTVGREGMAGLPAFLADDSTSLRAVVQISGLAHRASAKTLADIAAPGRALYGLLLRYTQAFLTQVAQTAACNGQHLVEQRCARWLLMTCDRVDGDEFGLTHEFLAFMLGVRRAGVTVALRALKDGGLIDYSRGKMKIVDREGLQAASCECYRVVRGQYERLLPGAA